MFGGRSKADQWPDLIWTVTDTTVVKDKSFLKTIPKYAPSPTLPKTSFLQYTSGSTSYPKGVVITHASLAHNLAAISASLRTTPATVCCSWLPQYHDMGLIGSYLGLLYCGGTGHYMSPLTFITNPLAYLRLWSSCNATHLQMPNFALRLCVKRFKAAKGLTLDLGKTQHIINAAEPIDHATCAEFIHLFNQECRLPKEVRAEQAWRVLECCEKGEQPTGLAAQTRLLEMTILVHTLRSLGEQTTGVAAQTRWLEMTDPLLYCCSPG